MSGQEAGDAGLLRAEGVRAVERPDHLDPRELLQHGLVAVRDLRRDRGSCETEVHEDRALAPELLRDPRREHARNRIPVARELVRARLGHRLVEGDDEDPLRAGPLERRVERRAGAGVDEKRVGMATDDVIERVDLRLDRRLDVLDLEVDATGQRAL